MSPCYSMTLFQKVLSLNRYVSTLVLLCSCAAPAAADGLDRRALTILGITPGESTFEDVARLYGAAGQWHTGDAHSSETKICFRFGSGDAGTWVVFASNSEMAGAPQYLVTDIRLYSSAEFFTDTQRCKPVLKGRYSFSTKSGVGLGVSAAKMEKILGKHERRENAHFVWVACPKIPIPETDPKYDYWLKREGCFEDEHGGWKGKPYYNACAGVTVGLKNGKVTYLELSSADSIC